jgi:hypothetical protein
LSDFPLIFKGDPYPMQNPLLLEPVRLSRLLPALQADVWRLHALGLENRMPTVMVLGKPGHGRRALLNGLVGDGACFAEETGAFAADAECQTRNGVRWMRAPALGVRSGPEQAGALAVARAEADLMLLVHSAPAGLLDRAELVLAEALRGELQRSGRAFGLVLTRTSEVGDARAEAEAIAGIKAQLPGVRVFPVAASGCVRGTGEQGGVLLDAVHLEELLAELDFLLQSLSFRRARERAALRAVLGDALDLLARHTGLRLASLQETRQARARVYAEEMSRLCRQVQAWFGEAGLEQAPASGVKTRAQEVS